NFGEYTEKEGGGFSEFKMYNNNIGVGHTHTNIFITNDNWQNYEVVDVPYDYFLERPFYFLDSNNIIFSNYEESNYNKEYTLRFLLYNISSKEWSVYSNVEKNDPINGDPRIWEIDVVNDSVIYASGVIIIENSWDAEVVWKSMDKGKNWKKVLSNINGYTHYSGLDNISFRNENHGFACTNSGVFYETTDGGETWYLHPFFPDVKGSFPNIVWAGDTPIYKASQKGIFRLETKSSVTEVSSAENIKVRKSNNSLEIAINDDSFANYNFQLYNISGQVVNTSSVKSSLGYIFQTIELPDMINGVYYYVLTSNTSVYNGKLIVIK
ncbi:MAG: T9SS type A sorting domain-containing protein, partial [Candidatus Kapaibacterium sp.]